MLQHTKIFIVIEIKIKIVQSLENKIKLLARTGLVEKRYFVVAYHILMEKGKK
jgi:hypothetical protein